MAELSGKDNSIILFSSIAFVWMRAKFGFIDDKMNLFQPGVFYFK